MLFGERVNEDGSVCWQLPGGKMLCDESPGIEAANRELLEETGLYADSLKLIAVTDNRLPNNMQTISLCFEGRCMNTSKLQNREPNKCKGWYWKQWNKLDGELYLPLEILRNTGYESILSQVIVTIHVSF